MLALSFAGVLLSSILVTDYPPLIQKIADLESYPGEIGGINCALARGFFFTIVWRRHTPQTDMGSAVAMAE